MLQFLIKAIINYTIPMSCLMFGIDYYYLFNKNKKLKHLIIAVSLFSLFILFIKL